MHPRHLITVVALVGVLALALVSGALMIHLHQQSLSTAACLLPSVEEGYQEPAQPHAPVICVNTGRTATPQDIAAGHYAGPCHPGGPVPCATRP